MPESTATGTPGSETPNGTPPQGETPNTPTSETLESTATTSPEDSAKELESLKAALKKANSEAAANRKAAKELQDLKAQAEEASLTTQQKLEKQLATAQAEKEQAVQAAQEVRVGSAIQIQAMQQGIDPALASKLIDRSEIEYDENGTPTNVADLLKALTKTYPQLVGKSGQQAAPTSGGATNPSRSASSTPVALSWDVITKLTPQEYEARRGEIQAWIMKNPIRYGQQIR